MDFDEAPEDAAFRKEARVWLEANAPAKGSAEDFSNGGMDENPVTVAAQKAWQRTRAEAGWACITWPTEYGGRGGTAIQAQIFAEEQARFGVTDSLFAVGIGMAGPTLIAHGTDEQKQRWIPPLLHGDEVYCQLFSEPGAGSDLAGLSTRADADGDEFLVNGQKVWTSGAVVSDLAILVARTDLDQPKHRGLSYFVLDMKTPGIEIRPLKQITGEAHFNEVFLTDVRVPAGNLIGGLHAGWGVAMTTLANERALIGGGQGMAGFPDLLALAQQMKRSGDRIVRQRLAGVYIEGQLLRYLGMRAQTAAQKGDGPGAEANVMKLFYAQHTKVLGELALELEGPAGMLIDGDAPGSGSWQQRFLGAPSARIAGGSDEVQRNIIGERVLGLPSEPRMDKGVPFRDLPKQ